MAGNTTTVAETVPSKGLAARAVGVILSPRATYTDIKAQPRVLGALGLAIVVGAVATFAFLSTDVGKQATLDMLVQRLESSGRPVPDALYARMESLAAYFPMIAGMGQLVSIPLFTLVIAGALVSVFNGILGGAATFKQVYAVTAHSWLLFTFQQLFVLPLDYAKQSMSNATNLAVFLPFLDQGTLPARFLGFIDLFWIWWIVNLAIGVGVLYKKRTTPIATTMLIIYVVVGLVAAAVGAALSGA